MLEPREINEPKDCGCECDLLNFKSVCDGVACISSDRKDGKNVIFKLADSVKLLGGD
jgi:hypothetical protein